MIDTGNNTESLIRAATGGRAWRYPPHVGALDWRPDARLSAADAHQSKIVFLAERC